MTAAYPAGPESKPTPPGKHSHDQAENNKERRTRVHYVSPLPATAGCLTISWKSSFHAAACSSVVPALPSSSVTVTPLISMLDTRWASMSDT